jgi:hypothetical protein
MSFYPNSIPLMIELETEWIKYSDSSSRWTGSILKLPPHYYFAPSTIFGLTRVSESQEDRKAIEDAANWGDPAACILELMVIRRDIEEPGAQAMPGGDNPSDRKRVVDEINSELEARELACRSLARLEEELGTLLI